MDGQTEHGCSAADASRLRSPQVAELAPAALEDDSARQPLSAHLVVTAPGSSPPFRVGPPGRPARAVRARQSGPRATCDLSAEG